MIQTELAEHAYKLAHQGIPIFPCNAQKQPCTKKGYLDATSDPDIARRMFLSYRNAALISMVTGAKTGIVVIDIDPVGLRWFRSIITRFRETRMDETPRKGLHLHYRYNGTDIRNSAGKLAKGVDVRGEGGSCIIPPSPGYQIIHDVEIAPLPRWIFNRLTKKPKEDDSGEVRGSGNIDALCRTVAASTEGQRNAILYWASCRLREAITARNASIGDQEVLLSAALQAGLPRIEALSTIKSGLRDMH
jgi:hypothetical protein